MLPSAGAFAAACDAVGVTNGDQVVVYDGAGLFSAARGWWMFKVFGHDAVALLDGGMGAWESLESAELETSPPLYPASASADACARHTPGDALTFDAVLKPELVLSKADVLARCVGADADEILVDARPKAAVGGGSARATRGDQKRPRAGQRVRPVLRHPQRYGADLQVTLGDRGDVQRGGRGSERDGRGRR
jgi:thiosulfate/3-mercaptopyruvate sulfurtransferase